MYRIGHGCPILYTCDLECSMSNKHDRQKQILLDAAASALGANPAIGMSALAKELGVARSSLYRYFPSKEELVRDLIVSSMTELDAAVTRACEGALSYQQVFRALIETTIPRAAMLRVYELAQDMPEDPVIRAALDKQAEEMTAVVEGAKSAREIDRGLPTRWILKHLDALIWVAWGEIEAGYLAPRQAPELVFETFWRSVTPRD